MHTPLDRRHSGPWRDGPPLEPPLLLSVPEAAHLLGVGATLGWDMVHRGALPSIRLGRRVLVPRAAVEQLSGVTATTTNAPHEPPDSESHAG